MRTVILISAFLILLLGSCTTYKKVSLNNFQDYKVSYDERENLHYVLKSHKLHFSDPDSRINSNYYAADKSAIYKSQSVMVEENIVIPTGAIGVCVNSDEDNFIIDFGHGILVPFKVYSSYNKAKSEIVVDERAYSVEVSNRNASLYFDTREVKASNSSITSKPSL